MHKDIKKVLISSEEIENKVEELGVQLTKDYMDKKPLVIGLLKGCVPFMGDLIKKIDCHLEMDFMDVSSYEGINSTGVIRVNKDITADLEGRDIIIAEDIVDTGRTLKHVIGLLKDRGAKSVKVVTLLDKPEGRVVELEADYVGFIIPKEFVIGYGLDYNEYYRNLPYIGVLKEEVYSK